MNLFPNSLLNPDIIIQKLSTFAEEVHLAHFNTTEYAQHQALNFYDDLVDFKDKIGELLLGYFAPKRFSAFSIKVQIKNPQDLIEEIIKFAHDLEKYAQSNKFADLSNIAQELEGGAIKVKYLLTLK